jgi:hypothetical protein
MNTNPVDSVALEGCRLLLGVARLGDRDLHGWWRSSAMDTDVGGFVLGNAFPRTGRIVAAELLILSASRRHAQVIDRRNAVHLFSERLGFLQWTRAWLSEQKTGEINQLIAELEGWTSATEAAEQIANWASSEFPKGEDAGGGFSVGRVPSAVLNDPFSALVIARKLAAGYAQSADFRPPFFNVGES